MATVPQATPAPSNGGLGSLPIDPDAESTTMVPASVTGQQESDFYKQGGLEYQLKQHQQHLGYLGKFFGSNGTNAPASTNIAGLVVCGAFAFFCLSWLVPSTAELAEVRKLLLGLISTALAYIFGAASKK